MTDTQRIIQLQVYADWLEDELRSMVCGELCGVRHVAHKRLERELKEKRLELGVDEQEEA